MKESDDIAVGGVDAALPSVAGHRDPLPMIGLGGTLLFQVYEPTDGGKPFANWICSCRRHGCKKTRRVTDASTREHGLVEPVAWLHEWIVLHLHPDTRAQHMLRATVPSAADVARWVERHGAEAKTIWKDCAD